MKKIIVIGGGAAGMAAAIAAAENGCAATIYEKNEKLGKKIYITGKGRCNVTNDCDMEGLFDSVVTNSRFLYSAFYGFSNQDMKDFLEANGCHVKVERGNRVFPVSDRASDVTSAFARRLRELRVKVELNQVVRELWLEDGVLKGVILAQGGNERGKKDSYIAADAVIVATGQSKVPFPHLKMRRQIHRRFLRLRGHLYSLYAEPGRTAGLQRFFSVLFLFWKKTHGRVY